MLFLRCHVPCFFETGSATDLELDAVNAGISLSLPLQCRDHKCVPMPSFL